MTKKIVLMDIDGTIAIGSKALPGAIEAVEEIRRNGCKVIFFTNNSQRTRDEITDKLNMMGFECAKEDVVSSGFVAAVFAKKEGLESIYISGTEGLRTEFKNQGITIVSWKECRTLVIGMDSEFDFHKMRDGINAAFKAETIVACNEDKVYACDDDLLCPGCGGMVSCIEFCSGKKSDVVIGKPGTTMVNYIVESLGANRSDMIIVGDNYESDVIGGRNSGVDSV